MTIPVQIRLSDHLIDLIVGELLSEIGHNVSQLGGRDESVAVPVEHLESLDQFLLGVRVLVKLAYCIGYSVLSSCGP